VSGLLSIVLLTISSSRYADKVILCQALGFGTVLLAGAFDRHSVSHC
jgi:hypothetical protein